jgi:hypothetical protein
MKNATLEREGGLCETLREIKEPENIYSRDKCHSHRANRKCVPDSNMSQTNRIREPLEIQSKSKARAKE